jgi:O-antigen/teichoic acid export membrane protein
MTDLNAPTEQPRRSAGRIIARNTAMGLVWQMALRVVSFLFQVLVIRQLGDAQFGQYSIVLAWTALFSVLGDFGVTQYFTREVSRDAQKTTQWFWDMVSLRVLMALIACVVTTASAVAHPYPPEIVLAIFLYTLTYFLQAFLVPLTGLISGNERVDITSFFEVMGQIVFMVFGALFLFAGKDFVWLVIAGFINIPILIGMSYYVVRKNHFGPPRFHLNIRLWWQFIVRGLPFAFIQLALSFSFRVDTIVLSGHHSNAEIGWYNIAYGLTLNFLTLTRAFNNAITPTLAREHAADPKKAHPWYFRSFKYMMFLGLPIALGGTLLADPLISTIYGPENRLAALAFMILIWDLPIVMYSSFCGNMTTSITRERGAAKIYGTQGVVNVILNLILVPALGMIGASFATVLTDFIGAALFYFLFRDEFGRGLGMRSFLRLAVAVVAMGVVVWFVSSAGLNLFVVMPLGAVLYLVFVWNSGAFSVEERAQFTGLARRLARR